MSRCMVFWATSVCLLLGTTPDLGSATKKGLPSPGGLLLHAGEAIEQQPRATGTDTFQIYLPNGYRTTFSVLQMDLDVELVLYDPRGRAVAYMDQVTGPRGTDQIRMAAELSGLYTLSVRVTRLVRAETASYRLEVAPLEPRQADDWRLNRGHRTLGEVKDFEAVRGADKIPLSLLEDLRTAGKLFRQASALEEELMAVSLSGKYLSETLRLREAVVEYSKAAALCTVLEEPGCAANFFLCLARLQRRLGEPQEALESYHQVVEHAETHGAMSTKIKAQVEIADLQTWLGDIEKARLYLDAATHLMDRAGVQRHWTDQLRLGKVLLASGDYAGASIAFHHALALFDANPDSTAYGVILMRLGQTAAALGLPTQAESHFRRALQTFRLAKSVGAVEASLELGSLLLAEGREEQARQFMEGALRLAEAFHDTHLQVETLYRQAQLERRVGNLPLALHRIEEAEALVWDLHLHHRHNTTRTLATAASAPLYELYVEILMGLHKEQPGQGHDRRAFEIHERYRYRALLGKIQKSQILLDAYASPQHAAQLAALDQQIESALQRVQVDIQDNPAHHAHLARLLSTYQSLRGEILATTPHYRRLTHSDSLTVEQIQERILDEDSVLLEYALGETQSFLWMVTQNSFQVFFLPGRQQIEALAREVYSLLTAPAEFNPDQDPAQREAALAQARLVYPQIAGQLSETILRPVIDQLGDRRLLIAADRSLLYIPFAVLPDPRYSGRNPSYKPLILQHEIVSLPSASSLLFLRDEPWTLPEDPRIAMVVDPVHNLWDSRVPRAHRRSPKKTETSSLQRGFLPKPTQRQGLDLDTLRRLKDSAREAEAILELGSRANVIVRRGFSATIEETRGMYLGAKDIVHFAVHGLVDPYHPELSGLVLTRINAAGETIDGFLSLHDISTLDLGEVQLVTLSACQTALGKEVPGEGLIGLTRGFFYAGVPRVVGSLWQVEDSHTAALMETFYEGMLLERLTPGSAMQRAQKNLWQQVEDRRLPYSWGAFIVQGDWR